MSRKSALAPQADHHIDAGDLGALGRLRQLCDLQLVRRRIGQPILVFPEEMRMVMRVGVEIAFRAINRHFLYQPRIAKRPERVVDRGQRHPLAALLRLGEKAFCRDMAMMPIAHQHLCQCHALARRSQAGIRQPPDLPACRLMCHVSLNS
eukprot:CAMPEP_0184436628 /NCGR_PEP_ID=MMETSP0738-20130409/551298_1 /TAXON_ID=385413 /ORGANISM="Thalassiosira miniscula, Strain CCMP1093" /LENGTH=149 /DNA_ID=CAMNT_0026803419 /DNA_START=57 /DNA_END=503 /DNA_ORIENTATION=-